MAQASTVSVSSVHRVWRSLRFLNAIEAEVPAAEQVHRTLPAANAPRFREPGGQDAFS